MYTPPIRGIAGCCWLIQVHGRKEMITRQPIIPTEEWDVEILLEHTCTRPIYEEDYPRLLASLSVTGNVGSSTSTGCKVFINRVSMQYALECITSQSRSRLIERNIFAAAHCFFHEEHEILTTHMPAGLYTFTDRKSCSYNYAHTRLFLFRRKTLWQSNPLPQTRSRSMIWLSNRASFT
jgi:hypothetical protein